MDSDFVDQLDSVVRMERMDLWAPSDMLTKSKRPPRRRLSKKWHELLEECFELTVISRHYQTSANNMTSEAASGMDDFDVGRLFVYSFYTGVLYQDAVIEHTKTVISLVSRIYGSREGIPNQLKERCHKRADTLKKRTKEARDGIAHGAHGVGKGRYVSQALTEGQLWENHVAIGILPHRIIDHHYDERGHSVHSGYYDELIETRSRTFLDNVARLLHDFEQEIVAPS